MATLQALLVDDQRFILDLLSAQLRSIGLGDVVAFDTAEGALAHIARDARRVDVVFCDLNMPAMDGVQFVRRLVEVGYAGALVLMSAEDERILATAEKIARGHRLAVLGALRKPISVERLRAVLAAVPSAALARLDGEPLDPAELRHAIGAGQLVNHYQPKVRLESGALAGAECLVRWRHPERGLIYPDRFIAMAEDHALIDELTLVVLRAALADAKRWSDEGLAVPVAVNVSMDNLTQVDFADRVADEARRVGMPSAMLALEVTESRLMNDRLAALEILTRLRLKGIGLSIDDFGTGHSSLAQLREIPFTGLKIDRGFVHGASRDPAAKAIVEASLAMAKKLGMETVAEGVEDAEDWHFLHAAGCDVAQGHLVARPLAADELPAWAQGWEQRRRQVMDARSS